MLKTFLLSAVAISAIACGSDGPGTVGGEGSGKGGGGGFVLPTSQGGQSGGGGIGSNAPGTPGQLNFIIRDFKFHDASDETTNPDFENVPQDKDGQGNPVQPNTYWGPWDDPEIVADQLGTDHLPVYKNAANGHPNDPTLTTHGEAKFHQWFHNVEGTNIMQAIPVTLTKNSDGTYGYDSSEPGPLNKNKMFFPIDDGTQYATAFGDQGQDADGNNHNYSFTLEIHTTFTYQGGEHFTFRGDDDLFVFIDDKLVTSLNLGGIHGSEPGDVSIDSLGLTKGNDYNLDFFYAERHVVASDLKITTGLALSNNDNIPIL